MSNDRVVQRDELVSYLDAYLEIDQGGDYGPNGLQVEGRSEIRKLVTGVSSCRELHERAADSGADAVLVHHGIFWDWTPRPITGAMAGRVRPLMAGEINLLSYHLPLDRHPEVGNNAVAARTFGLEELEPFVHNEGMPIGFRGRFPSPIAASELLERCEAIYQRPPLAFDFGPDPVTTLGIVSGAAQKDLYEAIDLGLDAYITGEVSEWVMNVAREGGIHYLSAGHYATERLGPLALGDHVREKFGIEVEFIDIPNPV